MFQIHYNKHLGNQILSLLIFCTSFLIFIGACIRMTNSGLSCPDWPLCYGLWLPTYSKISNLPEIEYGFDQVLYEWTHRFLAGFLIGGLMILLVFYQLYETLWWKRTNWKISLATFVCLLLIIVQVLLGSFTVFEQNSSWTVTLHQVTALCFLVVLWFIKVEYLKSYSKEKDFRPSGAMKFHSFASVFLCIVTMASGAMMAKSGASLVYPSWLLIPWEDLLLMFSDPLYFLNGLHRFLAFLLLLNNFFLFSCMWKSSSSSLRKVAGSIFFFTLLQCLLGGVLIFFAVPYGLNLVHLFLSLFILSFSAEFFWIARKV